MTADNFNSKNEQTNIAEVNKKNGANSIESSSKIATDYLDTYKQDPAKAATQWKDVRSAISSDALNLPKLEIIDHTSNTVALNPLLQNHGELFNQLDNAQNGDKRTNGGRSIEPNGGRDGNIGTGDMEAWLAKHKDDPNYQFVQDLRDGKIRNSSGDSVLNGDGGIDVAQMGRLTGVADLNSRAQISDVVGQIESTNNHNLDLLQPGSDAAKQQAESTKSQLTNMKQLAPLFANNGQLLDRLDNAQHGDEIVGGGKLVRSGRDGNIGKGDMEAWLSNPANANDPDRQFVQDLHDAKILNADGSGNSVLNGDAGIDKSQLGRLTGTADIKGDTSTDDMVRKVTDSAGEKLAEVQAATQAQTPDSSADQNLLNTSIATAGDGYIAVAARLAGNKNTDDPQVEQMAKELQTLNPGARGDGLLNLNESVLTPELIAKIKQNPDQFPTLTQLITTSEQNPPRPAEAPITPPDQAVSATPAPLIGPAAQVSGPSEQTNPVPAEPVTVAPDDQQNWPGTEQTAA